jgi:hypothetical protein
MALKDEVSANMTKANSWKNGVMSGGVPYDGKWDIPMSEKKALPNSGVNKDTGKPWPEALKYTNTTAAAQRSDSGRNTTNQFNGDGGMDYHKK